MRRYGEILAVILTGVGRFVFMIWLEWKAFYIIAAILGWSIYVIVRIRKSPGLWQDWGFSRKNLTSAFYACLGFSALALIIMAAIGYQQNNLTLSWHMFPLLVLYPIWGFIQQFLMQGLVTGNLSHFNWPKWIIIPFVGLLFGLVHLPFPILTAATCIMGMVFAWMYLTWQNLWPLGLFHGWLGVMLYFWVLGRDPLQEIISSM